jgi:hypothetical protein
MEDEVLYAAHNEPEEISVDYVVQKCKVVFVKNAERNENMNGGVVHDLQTYYAPLHLAYDCNRSLVLRVNVDI